MSDISRINYPVVKANCSNLTSEKDNFISSTYATFLTGYISESGDDTVAKMATGLRSIYKDIKKAYEQIESWWNGYLDNLDGIENALSNDGRTGSISESLIRNFITSSMEELPGYQANFATLQFEYKGTIEFAKQAATETITDNTAVFTAIGKEVSKTMAEVTSSFSSKVKEIIENAEETVMTSTRDNLDNFSNDVNTATSNAVNSILSAVTGMLSNANAQSDELFNTINTESEILNDEKNNSGSNYDFDQLIDTSLDSTKVVGLFGENVTYGLNGEEINFDKKTKSSNGDILYWKDGEIIKRISSDGSSCSFTDIITGKQTVLHSDGSSIIYEKINGIEITTTYNADGSYSIKTINETEGYPNNTYKEYNADGKLLKESIKIGTENVQVTEYEYYENGDIKSITYPDGNYQKYDSNGLIIEEKKDIDSNDFINGANDISVKYDNSGNIISMTREDGTTFRNYNPDGSFIQYNNDGTKLYEENADGSSRYFINYEENKRPVISSIDDAYDGAFSQESNTTQDILTYDSNHNLVESQRTYTNGDVRVINSEGDITYNSNGGIVSENKEYGAIVYENGKPVSLDFTQRPFGGYSMSSGGGKTTFTSKSSGSTYILNFNEDGTKVISIEDYNGNVTTFENGINFIK